MSVSVNTREIKCALEGSASGLMVLNTTIEIAVVGPETRCQEEPNRAAIIAGTIAEYKPYSGGKPAMVANATPWGSTMIAPLSPAKKSSFKLPRVSVLRHRRNGKSVIHKELGMIFVAMRVFSVVNVRRKCLNDAGQRNIGTNLHLNRQQKVRGFRFITP